MEQCLLKELRQIQREEPDIYSQINKRLYELCRLNLAKSKQNTRKRHATSLIKAYDLMIQNELTIHNLEESLAIFLANVKLSKDMRKLILYVDLFGDVLLIESKKARLNANQEIIDKVMFQLMTMLCHEFSRVRKYTAAKLFEVLMYVTGEAEVDEAYT